MPDNNLKNAPISPMAVQYSQQSFAKVARKNKENAIERINQPVWYRSDLNLQCDQVLDTFENVAQLPNKPNKTKSQLDSDLFCEQQLLPNSSSSEAQGQQIECIQKYVMKELLVRTKGLLERYASQSYQLREENYQLREQLRRNYYQK